MVYDREGRKLWIVEDTGKHKPVGSWEEISKRPRRPDLPDWWVVAKDIGWGPPVTELFTDDAGHTGKSLLSMHQEELERALAAAPGSGGAGAGSGGTGTKLGCGGACQESYDTATGKYVGTGGGNGGGQTKTKSETPKTKAPAKTESAPTKPYKTAGADSAPEPTPYAHKKAGADNSPWPESDPPTPPGVSLEDNMREAEAHKGNLIWFYNQVDSNSPWDYKNVPVVNENERIEDFGNFNYGATGAALGIPEDLLHRAAGDKQLSDHPGDPTTTTDRWAYPYGDERRDAAMIRRGYEYYWRWKANQKLKGPTK